MKKSLDIHFRAHFGQPKPEHWPEMPTSEIPIRHAERQYYSRPGDWALAQEFDGKNGYLFSYDLEFETVVDIPIAIEMPDLYVVYLMGGEQDMVIYDESKQEVCRLAPGRACYLYVPPGNYHAHVATGRHTVFGFYFDGGIFRDGNERSFTYLQELISAYRKNADQLIASIDFRIGPQTLLHIQHLCSNLQKGNLHNEAFVFNELTKLILLSKDKIFAEYERISDPELLIQRFREFLGRSILRLGAKVLIKDIARQMDVRYEYLNRLHKQFYGENLSDYRNALLLAHIKTLLQSPESLLEVSLQAGFHGPSELNRFFKKQCGITPMQYREQYLDA